MDLGGAKEIVANRVSRQTETSDLVVLTWLYFLVLPKHYKIMNFFHSFKHIYSGNYYTTFVLFHIYVQPLLLLYLLLLQNRQNRRQSLGEQGPKSVPRGRPAATSTRQPIKNGLKISFKPADLSRTTDKSVALQIRAVLSKQRGEGGGAAARRASRGNAGILSNSVSVSI